MQEQEGPTEDIFIHRTSLRGGYKTENTNTKHTVQVEIWYSLFGDSENRENNSLKNQRVIRFIF